MEPDDPEKHIADLERQLADAKAAAGQYDGVQPPAQPWDASGPAAAQIRAALSGAAAHAGVSQAQLDDALRQARVTINTGHSVGYPGMNPMPQAFGQTSYTQAAFRERFSGRRRSMNGAGWVGATVGLLGGCIGGAAALTAVWPSSALWTSSMVCGAPKQLMINTSHYSYKPGQSGTTVDFQCLRPGGAQAVNFLVIGALQLLVVLLVVGGLIALGSLVKRFRRNQPLTPVRIILSGALGLVSIVVLIAFVWQAIAGSSGPIQMPPGGSLTVKGNGETKTIACNGGHLTVDGRDETVTVTGHCSSLSVEGVIHHVTIDSADAIDVDGVHNVVTYHSGSPKINDSGLNSVKQG
jgi:hypothetical protein